MNKKVKLSERQVIRSILDLLEARRITYIRVHPVRPVTHHGQHHFVPVRPSQLGVPDIICWPKIWKGLHIPNSIPRYLAIEAKSTNGKMSLWQKSWERKVTDAGGLYLIARSPEDVMSILG